RKRTVAPSSGEPTEASTVAGSIGRSVIQLRMSAAGYGREQCELVTVPHGGIQRDVLLVERDHGVRGQSCVSAAARPEHPDGVSGRGTGRQVEIDLAGARDVAVVREEEEPDSHRR